MPNKQKIVITRSNNNSMTTADLAREYGFEPIIFPLLELNYLKGVKPEKQFDQYDWIVFTSINAVEYFMEFLNQEKLTFPDKIKTAAVGPKTAEKLRSLKIDCHFMPGNYGRRALAEEFPMEKNASLLYPALYQGPTAMEKGLLERGINVERFDIYESKTVFYSQEDWQNLLIQKPDVFTFFSPKAVKGFLSQLPDNFVFTNYTIAVLGDSSVEEFKKNNIAVQIKTDMPLSENLFEKLKQGSPKRLHRLRSSLTVRNLIKENQYTINDLVYPLFVTPGENIKDHINAMPGQYRFSIDTLLEEIEEVSKLGIKAFLLFGVNNPKSADAAYAFQTDGLTQKAIEIVKTSFPEIYLIADVCMCAYTDHGHCGIIKNGKLNNDLSLEVLAKTALSYAHAGVDMVAPSAMMDGQVKAIRKVLDENNFPDIAVMGYSAKFYSSFYGPFREAADSAPQFGDRSAYQMEPANSREALQEIEADIAEGADVIMIKPALIYQDIIWQARQRTNLPIAVYNVSGEYSMVKSAAKAGYIDEKKIVIETLNGFKRAGADWIITYFSKQAAEYLK